MDLTVKDITSRCYSSEDGRAVYDAIKPHLLADRTVRLSFDGCREATSSFVNAALIDLLDVLDYDRIRSNLQIVDSTSQINDMIRRRFKFEVAHRVS